MAPTKPRDELVWLLAGQINSLSRPPTDNELSSLALLVGQTKLLDALDLIDRQSVTRTTLPNGRALYQVFRSAATYTVHPDVRGGYCPCPAFSQGVLFSENEIICKHLLATQLANRLGMFVDHERGLKWLSTTMAKLAPPPPPAPPPATGPA